MIYKIIEMKWFQMEITMKEKLYSLIRNCIRNRKLKKGKERKLLGKRINLNNSNFQKIKISKFLKVNQNFHKTLLQGKKSNYDF